MKLIFMFFIVVIYGQALSIPSSESFDKTRAKQMSKKSDRYRYINIKNKRDLRNYNKYRNLCEDLNRQYSINRGRKSNYIYIKNVKIDCSDASFGIKVDKYSSGAIVNHVAIKNTKIEGGSVNFGVQIDNYNGETINTNISNSVDITNSSTKGSFKERVMKRGLEHIIKEEKKR